MPATRSDRCSLAGVAAASKHGPQRRTRASAQAAAAAKKGPVVVIDNYDSFTYNLCQVGPRPQHTRTRTRCCCFAQPVPRQSSSLIAAPGDSQPAQAPGRCRMRRSARSAPQSQYLGDLGADFVVFKNDEKTVDEIRAMNPAGVLVSPGPGALSAAAACSSTQLHAGGAAVRAKRQPASRRHVRARRRGPPQLTSCCAAAPCARRPSRGLWDLAAGCEGAGAGLPALWRLHGAPVHRGGVRRCVMLGARRFQQPACASLVATRQRVPRHCLHQAVV